MSTLLKSLPIIIVTGSILVVQALHMYALEYYDIHRFVGGILGLALVVISCGVIGRILIGFAKSVTKNDNTN